MKKNLIKHSFVGCATRSAAKAATTFTLAMAVSLPVSLPALAGKNVGILPPSMRAKTKAIEEAPALAAKELSDFELFEEWKKSKGENSSEYEEFLLWQEFLKTQEK